MSYRAAIMTSSLYSQDPRNSAKNPSARPTDDRRDNRIAGTPPVTIPTMLTASKAAATIAATAPKGCVLIAIHGWPWTIQANAVVAPQVGQGYPVIM